jgi:hypothetical protein
VPIKIHAGVMSTRSLGRPERSGGPAAIASPPPPRFEGPFEIIDIWVNGLPGNTRVAVAWKRRVRSPDGSYLPVYGMNRIRLGVKGAIEEDIFVGLPALHPRA